MSFEQKMIDLIAKSDAPRTRESLAADFRRLGLQAGATVIVHSSLSALGWVNGGAVAVVLALMDAVTDAGTIVTPAHSYYYSDPGQWNAPPVPKHWVEDDAGHSTAFRSRHLSHDNDGADSRGVQALARHLAQQAPGVFIRGMGQER